MKIYTVVDIDDVNGMQVFTFSTKEKAVQKFERIIGEYKELLGEFGEETEIIENSWAYIESVDGCEAGRISLECTELE